MPTPATDSFGGHRKPLLFLGAVLAFVLVASAAGLLLPFFLPPAHAPAGAPQTASLETFRAFKGQRLKLPSQGETVSLVAVGDLMLSRVVADKMKQHGADYPFLKVSDFLSQATLAFGNLETPITPGRHIEREEMRFRADPRSAEALRKAGFDIVSLANNHTPNFGAQGLLDTFNYLKGVGIQHAGAGENDEIAHRPAILTAKGLTFAFLAFNDHDVVPQSYEAAKDHPGTSFMNTDAMTKAVKQAKTIADFVIVSMHSGTEYAARPNTSQTAFAHAAIDAGAELVLGHHPHVVQPLEQYKGKWIFYSLGNFVFDQMQSRETREGLLARIGFRPTGVSSLAFYPTRIEDFAQPHFLEGPDTRFALDRLQHPLQDGITYSWDAGQNLFAQGIQAQIRRGESVPYNLSKILAVDADKDGTPETYALEQGTLTITEGDQKVWQSSEDWWVDDFALADSTNDGLPDLNLSVWKSGNYGPSKPFWVATNDPSVKNHFFVFSLASGTPKALWQSSNLSAPNCEFKLADVDSDGKDDLVVLEGDYADGETCVGHHVAVWKWNGWGFANEWRSAEGQFRNLEVETVGGKTRISVDIY